MKRWITGLLLVLLACIPVLLSRHTEPSLLKDSDTVYLLTKIRERHDPLSWFHTDWPLENHFYRPMAALSFELDNALYGGDAAGYGWTNALLAVFCILSLFWLLRELTDRVGVATASTLLFALWHTPWARVLGPWCAWLALGVLVAGVARHRLRIRLWAPAALVTLYLAHELEPLASLPQGVIAWLPGRTATVVSLFVLLSLAAYCRYERLSAVREVAVPGPLDPPATKGTTAVRKQSRGAWPWAVVSVVMLAASLASYEQAVMAPALLLGCAVSLRLSGYKVRWGWQAAFWSLLIGYLLVRNALFDPEASRYQNQALRFGPGVWVDLSHYVFPAAGSIMSFLNSIAGLEMLFLSSVYVDVGFTVANIVAFWEARRRWILGLTGYALSVLAFLPMAWLNRFEHYHYLPMAFRSLFAVAMGLVALDLISIALSPPAQQAPPRLSPAPGSLPRP